MIARDGSGAAHHCFRSSIVQHRHTVRRSIPGQGSYSSVGWALSPPEGRRSSDTMQKLRIRLVMTLAGLAFAAPLLHAQDAPAVPPAAEPSAQPAPVSPSEPASSPTAPASVASNPALNATAAASLARVALLDLRSIKNPSPDDFAICGLLLRQASEWAPGNTQILHARVEAAHNAGDDAELLAASRDLVRADPQDTVAQLRLISSRLAQMQTAQERSAAYQQFLGKAGERLDPSIRSRLALDAAMLARELGDEKSFVANLKLATTLDGTNKDAALLALSYFSESVDNRAAHFELLTNVFYADPLDSGVMTQIRDELAGAGAWDQASRFHKLAISVLAARGEISNDDRVADHGITWHAKGPGEVLRLLNLDLDTMRDRQQRMFDAKTKTMQGGFDVRKAEDVRLSVPMDQLRLAAALTIGDDDKAESIVKDLIATNKETSDVLADPARRPQKLTDEDAARQSLELKVELAVWRLLAQQGVDEVVAGAPDLLSKLGEDNSLTPILNCWVALRTGKPEEAQQIAKESDVASGWLGVAAALAEEAGGDKPAAAATLRAVAEDEPLTPLGCWAWSHAKALDPGFTSSLATQMDRMARDVPLWVESMVARPTQHQRLVIDLEKRDARALDPVAITLRLKNLSPIPLSLGNEQALNARMLIIPSVATGEDEFSRRLSSDVVMLDQRLRLMPGEELALRIDPSIGSLGWVTGTASGRPVTEKYRVLQGFVAGDTGTREAGPACLDVTSLSLSRDAFEPSRGSPESLATLITGADEARLVKLAVATRAMLVTAQIANSIGEAHDAVAKAWAARWPSMSPQAKVAVLCELPPISEVAALKPLDEVAVTETDPVVQRAVLVTRVARADDAFFDRVSSTTDSGLAQLARLHHARLSAGAEPYAVHGVTSGVAAVRR